MTFFILIYFPQIPINNYIMNTETELQLRWKTMQKLNNYITDITNLVNIDKKIDLCLKMYNYLTTDIHCIKILENSDKFWEACIQKLESELSCNINCDKYDKLYDRLIKIKLDKDSSNIMICNFSNSGKKMNTINL